MPSSDTIHDGTWNTINGFKHSERQNLSRRTKLLFFSAMGMKEYIRKPESLFTANPLNPFMSSGQGLVFSFHVSEKIPLVTANNLDPDRMKRSAPFDLDLHCLPITLLGAS